MSEGDEAPRREVLPRRRRCGTGAVAATGRRGAGGDGAARRRRQAARRGGAAARLSDEGRVLRGQARRIGRERRRVLAAVLR
jgi:hypothetical protein